MSFNFPFGLLLLIAIPVLIIIYIIKNKYKEKVVSSSYIWDLSKKFLKKKNPFNTIANLLNLILQCLCIAFLSFSLADPVFNFKNSAENEVFILDASASMGTLNENGLTRFEEAKKQIKDVVDESVSGSTYTLLVSDSNSRTICKGIKDKEIFNSLLDRVQIDYDESELGNAISLAQSLSSLNEGSRFSLYTDKDVKTIDDFTSVNVSDTNKNYAINDLRINDVKVEEKKYALFEADVISYSEDTTLEVEFFLNEKSIGTVEQEVKQNYSSVKALIKNEDYLKEDSEFILYATNDTEATNVLIVSYSPFYFESAFNALNQNNLKISYTTVAPFVYDMTSGTVGYDVVIFDGYAPSRLPVDSTVWLFNTGESIPNSGFYVQKELTVEDPGIKATYSNNNDDLLYQELTKNLVKREITIKTYMRYTLTSRFTTILSYDNLPFIFAGRNEFEQKQIVFNFDLHNSDFPLKADFIILNYLDSHDIQTYTLDEVGTYVVKVESATGKTIEINLFSAFPSNERNPQIEDLNSYTITLNADAPKADRIFEALLVVVIIALIFLLADWMVYSHEQF